MRLNIKDYKVQYVMMLMSSGIVLALGFGLSIIFTHTMETAEYGYYRAFVNSITMLCTLTSFGFSLTFSREFALCKESYETKRLSGMAYTINIGISVAVFIVLAAGSIVAKKLDAEIPSYLVFAGAAAWVMLLNRFYLLRFQGENNMLSYAVLTVVPQLILTIVVVLFFVMRAPLSRWVAIAIYLFSQISILVILCFKDVPSFKFGRSEVKAIVKKNNGYGFQLYFGSLASVASTQLMNLMVAPISGLEAYAHFTLGVSLASPVMQIPAIMGTISFKANVTRNKLPAKQLIITIGITIAAIAVYMFFLKYIICYVIGIKYVGAISYAMIMVYYYALMGLGDYFNRFISAKGYGKEIRNSSFVVGGSLLLSAIVFIPLLKINGVIIAETISGAVYLLLMITKYLRILKMESEC